MYIYLYVQCINYYTVKMCTERIFICMFSAYYTVKICNERIFICMFSAYYTVKICTERIFICMFSAYYTVKICNERIFICTFSAYLYRVIIYVYFIDFVRQWRWVHTRSCNTDKFYSIYRDKDKTFVLNNSHSKIDCSFVCTEIIARERV
jgi:hypothetical protein